MKKLVLFFITLITAVGFAQDNDDPIVLNQLLKEWTGP